MLMWTWDSERLEFLEPSAVPGFLGEHELLRLEDLAGDPSEGLLLTGFELDRIEALQAVIVRELDELVLGTAW